MAQHDSDDFASLLAELDARGGGPEIGEKVSGTIVGFGEDVAFVDLGGKSEAIVNLLELTDDAGKLRAAVGDEIEAVVSGYDDSGSLVLRIRAGRGSQASLAELELAHRERLPVEGVVAGVVKGGVEVQVAGARAFCPVSQLDRAYVADPAVFVGQRLEFRIERLEQGGGGRRPNVVLSRRALLEEAAAREAEVVREKLEVGAVFDGVVTSIASYGAFVDIGGLEGLLHVSEMGHARVEDPHDVVSEGQKVRVKVTKIEPAKKAGQTERISLSMRALQKDPWDDVAGRFPLGTRVEGIVKRLETFGAFVELAPGVEGLVHVSQLGGEERLRHARDVLALGQNLAVTVVSVDPERKRIGLAPAPSQAATEEERDMRAYLDHQGDEGGSFGSLADFFKKAK